MDLEAAGEAETTQQHEYSLKKALKIPGSGICQEQVPPRAGQVKSAKIAQEYPACAELTAC